MSYAVLLYFDSETETKLKALKDNLIFPGTNPTHLAARPHISLAGFEKADPAALTESLWEIAGRTPALSVYLSAVGAFPTDEGVVFIVPTVTTALLSLHHTLHRLLLGLKIACHPYYLPDTWVPHTTVTMNIPTSLVPAAVETCRMSRVFGQAQLEEIALISYPPFEEIEKVRLMG